MSRLRCGKAMTKNIIIFLLLGLMIVPGLWGQTGLYLGSKLGFTSSSLRLGDLKQDWGTSFLYGAGAGMKIFNFGIELNYFRTFHNLETEEISVLDWDATKLGYHYLGLNGKFFFPLVLIHPYLTGGLGTYFAKMRDIGEDHSRGFNLGAGLEIHLGPKWAVCGEGRYHHVNLVLDEVDVKIRDFTFAAGLHFYF